MTNDARMAEWQQQLLNLPETQLPTDYPRPLPLKVIEDEICVELDDALCLALLQLSLHLTSSLPPINSINSSSSNSINSSEKQVTPFMLVMTSLSVLLHKYTHQHRLLLTTTSHTSNPLLLLLDLQPDMTVTQLVHHLVHRYQQALDIEVPFDALLEFLERSAATRDSVRRLTRLRILNHADYHLSSSSSSSSLPMQEKSPVDETTTSRLTTASSDMTLVVTQSPTSRRLFPIQLRIVYNTVLFTRDRMHEVLAQLQHVLHQFAQSNAQVTIDHLDLVTPLTKQRALLPDPTAQLTHDWPGAIHDILMRHAHAHPQRLCVIESLLSNNNTSHPWPTRSFTYAQINTASSILAQSFLCAGLRTESVIMIYAHRSVELVISILAVLKAGCTFSVLDPMYPENRQCIYLDVARPNGLVVIKKAGQISDQVWQFLADKQAEALFSLTSVCVDLEVSDSGTLRCGAHPNSTLMQVQQRFDASPIDQRDWIHRGFPTIGPDSIGTLSFTSGSTGIPKGVRGRHFSLTAFYPWMQRTFSLTHHDLFTMLSGIAHDPVQRDIFTPVFLGAAVCVPTAEDIGCPGRLAMWMKQRGCTVAHLTPAMGQLLTSGHEEAMAGSLTALDSSANDDAEAGKKMQLRAAFFVGDVLTKRDVIRLQAIADQCTVINMYGTTETQRAVSYYPISPDSPPHTNPHTDANITTTDATINTATDMSYKIQHQKNVLPAGKGMQGVQLILVNSRRRLCGVGEMGEIYVRSMGLAEGYLRLDSETSKKFVANFFRESGGDKSGGDKSGNGGVVLDRGPRDRMYKTGDLGRYRPDGIVECCGRADDQVKIRGFRIELGEIDTHLSQHPAVRENVTLVRRDAYEEKTLVSYFVINTNIPTLPADLKQASVAEIITSIRTYMKQKVPQYAVPSVFVPLLRMPLTPNGKVDKNALPYPDMVSADQAATLAMAGSVGTGQQHRGSVAVDSMTSLQKRLCEIWSSVLSGTAAQPAPRDPTTSSPPPKRHVGLRDNFFDLGGHSILATRLILQIRRQLKLQGEDVPLNLLFQCPTVEEMAAEIEKLSGFGVVDSSSVVSSPALKERKLGEVGERRLGEMGAVDVEKSGGAGKEGDEEVDLSSELKLGEEFRPRLGQLMAFDLPECQATDGTFEPRHVFLTGATGFLGAFLLDSLLKMFPKATVTCLVRADDDEKAWQRLERNMDAHMLWRGSHVKKEVVDEMKARTRIIKGDLAAKWLGIGVFDSENHPTSMPSEFRALAEDIDCVVHNGAFVHWVYPYAKLKPANVDGTLEALRLCVLGKVIKPFYFVSSTSVLDTAHYTELKTLAVLESDDLEGSRRGLKSGYGQSKWVAEKLLMMARQRAVKKEDDYRMLSRKFGLPVAIIRPGYILGDSQTGVTNTDDFLWRLVKGCLQLGKVPVIHNAINACPVDFVARSSVQIVRRGKDAISRCVYHIWNDQSVRFVDFFQSLLTFGYANKLQFAPYLEWRDALMDLTLANNDNALYPLLHFVLDDLPTSTKSPALDARNLVWALEGSGIGFSPLVHPHKTYGDSVPRSENSMVGSYGLAKRRDVAGSTEVLMERYLTYLCKCGFLEWPLGKKPVVAVAEEEEVSMLARSGK